MKKPSLNTPWKGLALVALFMFLVLAALRSAASPPSPADGLQTRNVKSIKSNRPGAGSAAVRMQVDPETGELVPLTPQAGMPQSPEAALSHSVRGLTIQVRPGGYRSVDLEGRFMESVIASVDRSDRLVTGCLPERDAEVLVQEDGATEGASGTPAPQSGSRVVAVPSFAPAPVGRVER